MGSDSFLWLIILPAILALGVGTAVWLNNRYRYAQAQQADIWPGDPNEYYSINQGNQVHLIHAVNRDDRWFRQAYDNYRWELFDPDDNRFTHYVKVMLIPLLKGSDQSPTPYFFDQCSRGQKMLYCLYLLDGCMKGPGLQKFLHVHPALRGAVLETLRELRQERMAELYALCLRDVQADPKAFPAEGDQKAKSGIDFTHCYAASENQVALFRGMCNHIERNLVQFVK